MSQFFNRPVNGLLVLDKPSGMTSNQALQQVRRLFRAKKAGHTGSLDPLASGVLPLCFGEATKFSQCLLDSDKTYEVTAQLGVSTDSGDADGQITRECPVPEWSASHIESALPAFRGCIQQVPSMFSALKHQGQPLYKLARQGITVHREARQVTIHDLTLLAWESPYLTLRAEVSKGTYIRSLVEDLGRVLGVGGHVQVLRRIKAGSFSLKQAVSLADLTVVAEQEGYEALHQKLQPIESAVADWAKVVLPAELAAKFMHGQSVVAEVANRTNSDAGGAAPSSESVGWVQVHHAEMGFLGIGEVMPGGRVIPRRLICFKE